MPLPNRNYSSPSYRYGYQGQEKDDEVRGSGNSISFEYRVYDSRIARFLSVDPLVTKYAFYSPYCFSGNRVLDATELEGLEPNNIHKEEGINGVGNYNLDGYVKGETELRIGKGDKQFAMKGLYDKENNVVGWMAERIVPEVEYKNIYGGKGGEGRQDAFFVTCEKFAKFRKEADKYYGISRNAEMYDVLWGEFDRGGFLKSLVDPRFWLAGRITGVTGGIGLKYFGNYVRAARLILREERIIETLVKASSAPDVKNPQLTKLANHMQSHSQRAKSIFSLKPGKYAIMNDQAESVLRKILTHPKAEVCVRPYHRAQGMIIEIITPEGGARFSADGTTFIGLIEP